MKMATMKKEEYLANIKLDEGYLDKIGVLTPEKRVWFIEFISPKKDELILDMGCGTGLFTKICLEHRSKVVATDYSWKYCNITKDNIKEYKSGFIVCSDGNYLPFRDNSFDKIVFIEVLEHIPKQYEKYVLKELYRVLKKDGTLLLHTSPNKIASVIYKMLSPFTSLFGYKYVYDKYVDKYCHINKNTSVKLQKTIKKIGFKGEIEAYDIRMMPRFISKQLSKYKIFSNFLGCQLKGKLKK